MVSVKQLVCAVAVAGMGLLGASSAVAQGINVEANGAKVKVGKDGAVDVQDGQGQKVKVGKDGDTTAEDGKGKKVKVAGKKRQVKAFAGCKNDVKKHCADVEPGEGRLKACLAAKSGELDKKCTATMERHDKRQEAKAVCGEDVKAHCAKVKPGKGRVYTCLKGSQDKLSEGCKARFAAKADAKADKAEVALIEESAAEVLVSSEGEEAQAEVAVEANP